jgi:hypothetical protein
VRDGYVETWKAIAAELRRSERWCRYMAAADRPDPLLVFKVGGIVRLNLADLDDWLGRQRQTPALQAPRGGGRRLEPADVLAILVAHAAPPEVA